MAFLGGKKVFREKKLSTEVHLCTGNIFTVILVYVLRIQSEPQTVSGGIQGSIHKPLYSIIGGRENILFIKGYMQH